MTQRNAGARLEEWDASWITRPAIDHFDWHGYAVEAQASIEAGGASLLFAVRNVEQYWGCELSVSEACVILYQVNEGTRREWGKAPAPELKAAATPFVTISISLNGNTVSAFIGERLVVNAVSPGSLSGSIGFATGQGQAAVFRDLRVSDASGRVMYGNRFYDPGTIQFDKGVIDSSGSGLRLGENLVSFCESPISTDSPLFRKSFEVAEKVVHATVRVYAAGWYQLSVNGVKADDRVLSPANSPYENRMLYDIYDVTESLQQGGNVLGLWLGNGYNHNYSRWGWKWRQDKAVALELDVELENGLKQRVITDESWLTTGSPLLFNDIYDGETFDGREAKRLAGWEQYLFTATDWKHAVSAEAPGGKLLPSEQPPVKAWEPLAPVSVLCPEPGVKVYDFGQNMAGWTRVRLRGTEGSRLLIRYSELVAEGGRIDPWTNRNARATDEYIACGEESETFEPRFTYHGFRYVEVTGDAEVMDIQAVPIHADVEEKGTFECADPLLNHIQSNLRWSFLNNLVSIPTDCPQRDERTPCQMDSAVVEEAAIHNFGMRDYYRKWLGDIAGSRTNPDWSGDQVTLSWYLYQYYGDIETLREHFTSMKAYIEHLSAKWPDSIVTEGFGDWCPPNEDGWEHYFGEVAIVNTALYFKQAFVVADAAVVLGYDDEARRYSELAERIGRSFLERFHQENGIFGSGSQTAQLMPLALGLVPAELIPSAIQGLKAAIEATSNHLDTGIYGTRYLLDVLADHGHVDLAYEMLIQPDYPGFGYQIAQGATTLWEQWSHKGGMHSHDHAMFGGIGASFYTRLAGIRPLAPGYSRIAIKPYFPEKLDWVKATLDTKQGRIVSAWRKEGVRIRLEVDIPANASAVVSLPSQMVTGGYEETEVGPGVHVFEFANESVAI